MSARSSLWSKPVITSAVHLHAPLALQGSRTPLHIVTEGRGWLRVSAGGRVCLRVFLQEGCDRVFFVDAANALRVQFRSLRGRAVVDVVVPRLLPAVAPPPPPPVPDRAALAPHTRLAVPDLRPPAVRPLLPGVP